MQVGQYCNYKDNVGEDHDALCVRVHSDTVINLCWVNSGGTVCHQQSVTEGDGPNTYQEDDEDC